MTTQELIKQVEKDTAYLIGCKYKELKGIKITLTLNEYGGIKGFSTDKKYEYANLPNAIFSFADKLLQIYREDFNL